MSFEPEHNKQVVDVAVQPQATAAALGMEESVEFDEPHPEVVGVTMEATDFQHYIDSVNKMAAETLALYEEISKAHNAAEGESLIQIAAALVQSINDSQAPTSTGETIEETGDVLIHLPINTPLARLKRAITLASFMSDEAILKELTLVDNVTATAAVALVQTQEAIREVKKKQMKGSNKGNKRLRNKGAKAAIPAKKIMVDAVAAAVNAAVLSDK